MIVDFMKQTLKAMLLAGAICILPSNTYAKDKDFNKVLSSLKDCAYSSYKNQANPSQENNSKEQNACSKFETLKQEKGISSLEDYFEKNGWFYVNDKDYIDGKAINSHYAARIIKKMEKEGFPIYLTRLGNGVDSFRGFIHNMKYLKTLSYPNGYKKIVIDLERIEKDSIKVETAWNGYKLNHSALLKGDIDLWNPIFEPVFLSLTKYDNIRKGCLNEKVTSFINHEKEHAKGNEEKVALSAEVNTSPVGLSSIQQNASKGKEAETAVLQCLMGTEDIFNKEKQAKFYLKGKKYIQQRANYCKKVFMKQRQNR